MSVAAPWKQRENKRKRTLVTPEGVSLPVTLAPLGSRAGAIILDYIIINTAVIVTTLLLAWLGISVMDAEHSNSQVVEFIAVLWVIALFMVYNFYFIFFEMGARGATPGKRATGIRVAAHGAQRLTSEAIVARNLMRQIELFVPISFIFMASSGEGGMAALAAAAWFAVFLLFPVFNRDNLRAGDLVAGTWVIEAPRRKLAEALSATGAASHAATSGLTGTRYSFDDVDLDVYGEYELQTLERVLRDNRPEALEAVQETICRKLGWNTGSGDERAFLEAFYAQLRAKLERDMRFGKRKADKHA